MSEEQKRKKKFATIIVAYPFVLIFIALIVNFLIFGVRPASIALPTQSILVALVSTAVLLLTNHTWLMTSTELTRLKYNMHATPEEWDASKHNKSDVSVEGWRELEKRQNAHRNTTENSIYFVFLALTFSMISPSTIAAFVWMLAFAIGRLGYTYAYLSGRDGIRGIFMSISLISLYGLASYSVISLIV